MQVKDENSTLHAISFPVFGDQSVEMAELCSACEQATFGKAGKGDPILDPSYRYVSSRRCNLRDPKCSS